MDFRVHFKVCGKDSEELDIFGSSCAILKLRGYQGPEPNFNLDALLVTGANASRAVLELPKIHRKKTINIAKLCLSDFAFS